MFQVNEIQVSDDEIHGEMQYHPATSREEAEREARRALLVRQILLQEAKRAGRIGNGGSDEARDNDDQDSCDQENDEAAIASLLEENVRVDEPDEAACRALYERSGDRLRSPDLFEGSHILFLAPSGDQALRAVARAAASETLGLLVEDPSLFESLARERSDCSSASAGGSLGQLRPGDTLPEFEAALAELTPGQIRSEPVETRFGLHVVRLDEFAPGRPLPFEAAHDRLRDYLREARWREQFHAYLCELASHMEIVGVDMEDDFFLVEDRHGH